MPTRVVTLPARHQLDYLAEHVRHLLEERGRSVLLVTANQSARRLWDYFASLRMDLRGLHIVDVVSSPLLAHARADSSQVTYLGNPMALETLLLRAERIARSLPEPVHVVVHNLNAFCLYNPSEVLEEALRRVTRDVADPEVVLDLVVEEEGGLYKDLDRYLQSHAESRKVLGPRLVKQGQTGAPPETRRQ